MSKLWMANAEIFETHQQEDQLSSALGWTSQEFGQRVKEFAVRSPLDGDGAVSDAKQVVGPEMERSFKTIYCKRACNRPFGGVRRHRGCTRQRRLRASLRGYCWGGSVLVSREQTEQQTATNTRALSELQNLRPKCTTRTLFSFCGRKPKLSPRPKCTNSVQVPRQYRRRCRCHLPQLDQQLCLLKKWKE